jgi:hypothetical protein
MKCDAPSDDARPDVLAVLRAIHKGGAAGIDPLGLALDPEPWCGGLAGDLQRMADRRQQASISHFHHAQWARSAEREGYGVRDRRLSGNRQRP